MWQDKLDPTIKEHFDDLLKKVVKEKSAYSNANNPSKAQLWSALAVLTKEVSDLRLEVQRLQKSKKKPNNKLKKALRKY